MAKELVAADRFFLDRFGLDERMFERTLAAISPDPCQGTSSACVSSYWPQRIAGRKRFTKPDHSWRTVTQLIEGSCPGLDVMAVKPHFLMMRALS